MKGEKNIDRMRNTEIIECRGKLNKKQRKWKWKRE